MKKCILTTLSILVLLSLTPFGYSQEDTGEDSDQNQSLSIGDVPSIEEIERRRANLELQRQQIKLDEEKNEMWLPRVMPFSAFIFVLLLLSIIFGYEWKKDKNRNETIRRYLEKGIEVPRQLLVDKDNPGSWKPVSDVRKGLIWFSVGLGVSLTLFIISESARGAAIGIIPLFIGIGYLVAAKLDPKLPVEED